MRINRDQMFMDMAEILARRSTCLRNNVGALIVSNTTHNIISCGYNGPASGHEHCTISTCLGKGCKISKHAEFNAINRAKLNKEETYSLYTTVSPCNNCSVEIGLYSNITKVFYRYPYRDVSPIQKLLKKGIQVFRVLSSGEILKEEIENG